MKDSFHIYDDEELGYEFEDPSEHPEDEPDNCAKNLPEEPPVANDPVSLTNSRKLRSHLPPDGMCDKVKRILEAISDERINLPIFLDALFWGDRECHSDGKCNYARTSLLVSDELPGIIRRWHRPPRRPDQQKGPRPDGALRVMEEFAVEVTAARINRELQETSPLFLSAPEDLSEEHLVGLDFNVMKEEVQKAAPVFWKLLRSAAYTTKQEKRNKNKNPDMIVLMMISQCQYTRSYRRGRVAKVWAVYLKACGLSARAFDALHSLGIVMSHKWTSIAFGVLSERAMSALREIIESGSCCWLMNHDNLNVPIRVFSQRIHNQSHFVSACAATTWILPKHVSLPKDINRQYQLYIRQNASTCFNVEDVLYGDTLQDTQIRSQNVDIVLQILLNCDDFADYPHKDDDALQSPSPIEALPGGEDNAVDGFILGVLDQEEASYDGTIKVMNEYFKQLHLHTGDQQKKTGLERFIPWLGDQLTVERLRGLWHQRHEDHNSFDRMDYLLPIFGWFHLIMTLANSLHKQYLGSSQQIGSLRHAFDLLKRKGLLTASTKGPFWHHLDEAIHHISEAHFLATWLAVGNVQKLSDLKERTPEQLRDLARRLIRDHASRSGLTHASSRPDPDQVQIQWMMWNLDVLPYLDLRSAIKVGDVGRMINLLPTLLFRFNGGGNNKYAVEVLELLQGLKQEWPLEIREHVKRWTWIFSRSGKPNTYLPFDLGMEENVKDIKYTYRSLGPGGTIEYMTKISPAIPTLRKLQRRVEDQCKTNTRGSKHGIPDRAKDVGLLVRHYRKNELHKFHPGRKLKGSASEDFVTEGALTIEAKIDSWFSKRTITRSVEEDWEDVDNL